MFDFLYETIAWILNVCYKAMFSNYALALLLFAVIVKVLMLPLGLKQHNNSLKQASLRPKEAAIVKKYAGRNDRASQQKRQMEIQEIQQKAGYSQFAGCLPMLIQLPIVIFVYNVIRKPLTYICGFSEEIIKGISNVAGGATDEIAMLSTMRGNLDAYTSVTGLDAGALAEKLPNFNLFGTIDLAQTPEWWTWLMLIPVLNFLATLLTSKLMRKLSYQSPVMQTGGADAKTSSIIMDLVMPLMSTWIAFSVPAAIGVYWIFQSLLGLVQQYVLVKLKPFPKFTEDDYKDAEREIFGKKKKNKRGAKAVRDPNKPYVPSLHHIDDDEYNAKVQASQKDTPAESKTAPKNGVLGGAKIKNYDDKKDGGKK